MEPSVPGAHLPGQEPEPAGGWRRARALARRSLPRVLAALTRLWQLTRVVLRVSLQVLLALLIVFEEWGWRPLADLLGRLARWQPWAALETGIARLPPYAALVVFVLPSTLLLPLKFLAIFLVAKGQIVLAGLLFLAAKVVATALIARLFMLTQPALMQIGWFAWGYETVMPWKDALVEQVRASWPWRVGRIWKERAKRVMLAQWRVVQPFLARMRTRLAPLLAWARKTGKRALAQVRLLLMRAGER
jgi:hypothetical protein